MRSFRQFFICYFKQQRGILLAFLLFLLTFTIIFVLYDFPLYAILYPALLCTFFGILFLGYHMLKTYRKHKQLLEMFSFSAELMHDFPQTDSIMEKDYVSLIALLRNQQMQLLSETNTKFFDMVEYYTLWAHQIKTPIASIRLQLQNENTEFSKRILEDLLRIEQYVEMALMFLRLDSDSSDYIIQSQDLDNIIRQAVKKFSTQFIRKKIRLDYTPLCTTVITDEKWLLFVIEQVLSNSLKYTKSGSISITLENPKILCMKDTGIGIAPEDLPRIFEKGYTGYNGRSDKKASGIGLYLCKRICQNLGHSITATSSLDNGTTILIDLAQKKLNVE